MHRLRRNILQAKEQLPASQHHPDGILNYLMEVHPREFARKKHGPLRTSIQLALRELDSAQNAAKSPKPTANQVNAQGLKDPNTSLVSGEPGSEQITPIKTKKRRRDSSQLGSVSDGELSQNHTNLPKRSLSEQENSDPEGRIHESDTSSEESVKASTGVERIDPDLPSTPAPLTTPKSSAVSFVPTHNILNDSLKNLYNTQSANSQNDPAQLNESPLSTLKSAVQSQNSKLKTPIHSSANPKTSQKAKADMDTGADSKGNAQPASSAKFNRTRRRSNYDEADTGGDRTERISSTPAPSARLRDLGGLGPSLRDIRELVEYPIRYPQVYRHLGATPPRGVLLHGPPGCGKTQLAMAIAGEMSQYGATFFKISAPEIVSGMSGESEKKLRSLFAEAAAAAPSIIFIDEIDAITPKRESAQREMERRIVAQMLTCMDDLTPEKTNDHVVLVLGATNRPDSLDPALRRAGRFDRELSIGIPDEKGRESILHVLSSKLRLEGEFDFKRIAKETPGYVGADLVSLTKEASVIAVDRTFRMIESREMNETENATGQQLNGNDLPKEILDSLSITMQDFLDAMKKVQPSAKREGFATIPDVKWTDIGALGDIQQQMEMSIVMPIRYPELFKSMGMTVPAGVLLYGPPGCGKTLLAKAVANQSGANFISIKGPELLNKFVGESERAVRQIFQRGRSSAPCVIFFDELDALCVKRGQGDTLSQDRVLLQLLTEMDGLDERKQVFVIAATNRPDLIDPAMLRPGRLDTLLYVPLPNLSGRIEILRASTKKMPIDSEVDLSELAARCHRFSGADLASLCREACMAAMREVLSQISRDQPATLEFSALEPVTLVKMKHFEVALRRVSPSVPERVEKSYEIMKKKIRCSNLSSDPEEAQILGTEPTPKDVEPEPSDGIAAGEPHVPMDDVQPANTASEVVKNEDIQPEASKPADEPN